MRIKPIILAFILALTALAANAQGSQKKGAITLTPDNVTAIIKSGKPVVVDFAAVWCQPCVQMMPIINELAKEYDGKVVIGKYDIDQGGDFLAQYPIQAVPTILFFKNGRLTKIFAIGAQPKEELEKKIKQLIEL